MWILSPQFAATAFFFLSAIRWDVLALHCLVLCRLLLVCIIVVEMVFFFCTCNMLFPRAGVCCRDVLLWAKIVIFDQFCSFLTEKVR